MRGCQENGRDPAWPSGHHRCGTPGEICDQQFKVRKHAYTSTPRSHRRANAPATGLFNTVALATCPKLRMSREPASFSGVTHRIRQREADLPVVQVERV